MLFFLVALLTVASSKRWCPSNERYMRCGLPCAPTCISFPRVCTARCVRGCFCKPGFIRRYPKGPCVRPHMCVKLCRKNEVYKVCGPFCQPTCHWPKKKCKRVCVRGCFCKRGYIRRHRGGPCVLRKKCPPIRCGRKHEVYKKCGPACQSTCSRKVNKCKRKCVQGCFCRRGYVRRWADGPCIRPWKCPSPKPLRCLLPVRPGPCKGSFRRYYYNLKKNHCVLFIYGGCRGNRNNFVSYKACKRTCGGK